MNSFPEKNTISEINSQTKLKVLGSRTVEVCPKCESIYITSRECEGCGYQFSRDRIGEAYGIKSFYAIKDQYVDSLPSIVRIFPRIESLLGNYTKKYSSDLMRRFLALTEHFMLDKSVKSEFSVEVKDLTLEMIEFGVADEFFLQEKWGELPYWFQMSIAEAMGEYSWQKKSQLIGQDFGSTYKSITQFKIYPILKWIFIYGSLIYFSIFIAKLSYSS